ncbi:MAG TPA: hypothetical protein VE953_02535 [Terriglobales bacterium]|nr:hypothetical protein [Terriglobales bacterium]
MRCDEARRRLLAHAWDHEASLHLESCADCFAALESGDPLAHALRGARPDEVPAPDGLADAVLARRPNRVARLAAATVLALVLVGAGAGALELLAGAGPAWVTAVVSSLAAGTAGALAPLVAVRDIMLGQPAALTVFGAVTVAICAVWLRLALRPPVWRPAR